MGNCTVNPLNRQGFSSGMALQRQAPPSWSCNAPSRKCRFRAGHDRWDPLPGGSQATGINVDIRLNRREVNESRLPIRDL